MCQPFPAHFEKKKNSHSNRSMNFKTVVQFHPRPVQTTYQTSKVFIRGQFLPKMSEMVSLRIGSVHGHIFSCFST
jgi:hypothetical protein